MRAELNLEEWLGELDYMVTHMGGHVEVVSIWDNYVGATLRVDVESYYNVEGEVRDWIKDAERAGFKVKWSYWYDELEMELHGDEFLKYIDIDIEY